MIHAIHNPQGSSDYYRTILPAKHCKNIHLHDHLLDSHFTEYDAFIFKGLPKFDYVNIIKHLKAKGKRIAWEISEDYWNAPDHFPWYISPQTLQNLDECLELSDIIISSTNFLDNPKVRVCPNLIDEFPKAKPGKRIVWAGSHLNHANLLLLVEPIANLITKYNDLQVIFFGDLPEPFCKYIRIAGTLTAQLTSCHPRIIFVPPVKFKDYYKKLTSLNGGIGLIALNGDKYNICKSNIKKLEYSMAEMVTVESNYEEKIDELLKNDLCELGKKAKEEALSYSWQSDKRKIWEKMFEELINKS